MLKVKHSPICIDISPIAHVALLHTDINSGFKLVPSMGIKSAGRSKVNQLSNRLTTYCQKLLIRQLHRTYQCTVWRAGSKPWSDPPAEQTNSDAPLAFCPEQLESTKGEQCKWLYQFMTSATCCTLWQLFTCMHWYIRVRMLLRATSCSMVPPKPSASPLRRSKATIMKSLSGASYWSGCDWWS